MQIRPTAGLAVLATWLAIVLSLAGCGSDADQPRETTLAVLVANSSAHDQQNVVTSGRVRSFDEPLHYWIEDIDLNRVEIKPHELIAPHQGKNVEVEGHFSFSRETGRLLQVESVNPVDP
ncbi:glucose-inhibited division protein B [Vreelandella aquamarina]|uniref:hypothetical protein n=1 Tax=Vreelandella aquamarina TaxID=77097 RepID=UPI0011956481|nr:hypothetical protein [Halomonas sp.]TVM06723.1 MAG: glucose-inhibited division protein B [Halomonas sp.]